MKQRKHDTDYPLWTEIPYAGESTPPTNLETPLSGSWSTYFIRYEGSKWISTTNGKTIHFHIRQPETVDWYKQLALVQKAQERLTSKQKQIAKYWGTGVATKQWTPIADKLIDSYGVEAPRAARILAALHAGVNDAFVVTWYYKFKWLVPRPDQLDQSFVTLLCTPRHPSYPSGHAAVAGAAEVILGYFFPGEKRRLHQLAKEAADSRLYAGVHYPVDNEQGLQLGRQVGHLVEQALHDERDAEGDFIDTPYRTSRHVELIPPPYKQAIPFHFDEACDSLVSNDYHSVKKTPPKNNRHKPRLFY